MTLSPNLLPQPSDLLCTARNRPLFGRSSGWAKKVEGWKFGDEDLEFWRAGKLGAAGKLRMTSRFHLPTEQQAENHDFGGIFYHFLCVFGDS
jgi:hypothetical protein